MVFCNDKEIKTYDLLKTGHNPYFNRWFSAILRVYKYIVFLKTVTILILIDGFLQFWFDIGEPHSNGVTILILIDGFLQ